MGSLSVGGRTTIGQQIGIEGSIGPNNIAVDAAIWGGITAVADDYSWVTVDDGAGRPLIEKAGGTMITGVVVLGTFSPRAVWVGRMLNARGSVTLVRPDETTHLPAIRVATPDDVVYY